jgi:hypothetical protein
VQQLSRQSAERGVEPVNAAQAPAIDTETLQQSAALRALAGSHSGLEPEGPVQLHRDRVGERLEAAALAAQLIRRLCQGLAMASQFAIQRLTTQHPAVEAAAAGQGLLARG